MQQIIAGQNKSIIGAKINSVVFSFIFSLVLFSATFLSAETLIPIKVQKGTNLIFLTRQFCTSEYHWKEIAKINNLTPPYKILAGDVIYAPVELVKTEKLKAKVASVVGGVFLVHNGKKLKRIVKGDEIFPGQTLVTEDDGFAHLIYPDNKYTRISSASKFTITYLVRLNDKSLKAEFFLEKGRITHAVRKKLKENETFTTRTPVSVTGVRGTEFRVKYEEGVENIVESLQGIVHVASGNGEVLLKKGEAAKIVQGEKSQKLTKLPPNPEVLTVDPMHRVLPVVIAAPASNDAKNYRLRITTDRTGNSTVLEQISLPGGKFTLLALADGKYYGFLTALNSENFESPPAAPFSFEVRTTPGAPIFIDPQEGKPTFDKDIKIQWLKAAGDHNYNLQLAKDNEFSEIVIDKSQKETEITFTDLEPGAYFFRVQAVAPDGFSSIHSVVDSWKVLKQAKLLPPNSSNENGTHLSWVSMGENITYDLQISKNKDFTHLQLAEEGLLMPAYKYSDYLEPATYYVRVRGVLNDGQASPWSSLQNFIIESPPFSWLDAGVFGLFLSSILLAL